jgi:hypothetical protein
LFLAVGIGVHDLYDLFSAEARQRLNAKCISMEQTKITCLGFCLPLCSFEALLYRYHEMVGNNIKHWRWGSSTKQHAYGASVYEARTGLFRFGYVL